MAPFVQTLLAALAPCLVLSLLMLAVGERLVGHRRLRPLAEILHRKKIAALERWPLSHVRRAVDEGRGGSATAILAGLILLKSAASLLLGVVMVFWLPLAALLVPTMVAAHDPDDARLAAWAGRVARLQVSSHALAAAPGFALVRHSLRPGTSVTALVADHGGLLSMLLGLSALAAVAAARSEARGLLRYRPFG